MRRVGRCLFNCLRLFSYDVGGNHLQLPENKHKVREEDDFGGNENEDLYVDDYHYFWSPVLQLPYNVHIWHEDDFFGCWYFDCLRMYIFGMRMILVVVRDLCV